MTFAPVEFGVRSRIRVHLPSVFVPPAFPIPMCGFPLDQEFSEKRAFFPWSSIASLRLSLFYEPFGYWHLNSEATSTSLVEEPPFRCSLTLISFSIPLPASCSFTHSFAGECSLRHLLTPKIFVPSPRYACCLDYSTLSFFRFFFVAPCF